MELHVEQSSPNAHRDPASPHATGVPSFDRATVRRTGEIACRAPFVFAHSLGFLQGFSPTSGEQAIARGVLTRAVVIGGQAVAIRVFQLRGPGGARIPTLRYGLFSSAPVDDSTAAEAVDQIAFSLSADEDLAPFHAIADRDGPFAAISARLRGFHHVKFATPFEAACWAVIHQRNRMPVARRMKESLVRELGASLELEDGTVRAFPEASTVAAQGEARLTAILGSDRKARAVHAVARAFSEITRESLRGMSDDALASWLRGIHGVGDFTTGFVMFRGLGRLHRLPAALPSFALAFRDTYGTAATPEALDTFARRYGPWAGHWMLYVWASTFRSMSPAA